MSTPFKMKGFPAHSKGPGDGSDLFGPKKTPWYPGKLIVKGVKKLFGPKKRKRKNLSKKNRTVMSSK
jgi:hypothetical protein